MALINYKNKVKTTWKIKSIVKKHVSEKSYMNIYFLPTILYSYNCHTNYFDPGFYHSWKVSFRFIIFELGFTIFKDTHYD